MTDSSSQTGPDRGQLEQRVRFSVGILCVVSFVACALWAVPLFAVMLLGAAPTAFLRWRHRTFRKAVLSVCLVLAGTVSVLWGRSCWMGVFYTWDIGSRRFGLEMAPGSLYLTYTHDLSSPSPPVRRLGPSGRGLCLFRHDAIDPAGNAKLVDGLIAPPWVFLALFAFYPAVVLVCHVTALNRANYRRKNSLCVECAYDLTGNVSGLCPECAHPLAESGDSQVWQLEERDLPPRSEVP